MRADGVSIVLASYNGACYVEEQLRSIMAQASPADEIIVLDDCSTDDTMEQLLALRREFPAITIDRNAVNLGVRATFNALLARATRDVVFLSDQDDVWIAGRKQRMIDALSDAGCVAVLANASILTEQGIGRTFFPLDRSPDVTSIASNFARNNFIGCCMAVRREVLALALPLPGSVSMHDWWLGTCAMAIGNVRYLPEPSLLYRRHGGNQSAGTRRRWSVVLRDRLGNVRALATLLRRRARLAGPKRTSG